MNIFHQERKFHFLLKVLYLMIACDVTIQYKKIIKLFDMIKIQLKVRKFTYFGRVIYSTHWLFWECFRECACYRTPQTEKPGGVDTRVCLDSIDSRLQITRVSLDSPCQWSDFKPWTTWINHQWSGILVWK